MLLVIGYITCFLRALDYGGSKLVEENNGIVLHIVLHYRDETGRQEYHRDTEISALGQIHMKLISCQCPPSHIYKELVQRIMFTLFNLRESQRTKGNVLQITTLQQL